MIIQRSMIVLLTLLQLACAVQKQDELECVLPNGDAFILINQYDYDYASVIFAPIAWHGAKRLNQYGFKAYYKPKDGKMLKESLGTFGHFNVADEMSRKLACADFFIFAGKVQSTGREYSVYDGKLANEIIVFPQKELIASQDRVIDGKKLYSPDSPIPFQIRTDTGLLMEYGLTKRLFAESPNIIDAVIQTHSTDNGQTWSDPIITKDAKLFEIGKSILDQPAVAKPGKWKKGPG